MRMRHDADEPEMMTAFLAGEVTQGRPIDTSVVGESVAVPRDHMDDDDVVFRAAKRDLRGYGIEPGDIFVVEPRPQGEAATAELVLTTLGDNAYIGRWWTKRGRRVLMDEALRLLSDDKRMRIIGTITVIMRHGDMRSRKRR
jgi:hypothetical protein